MDLEYKVLFLKPLVKSVHQMIYVPLAPLYLSAYLKEKCDCRIETRLFDFRLKNKDSRSFVKTLLDFRPDLVGIGVLNSERDFLKEYGGMIKHYAPQARIVVGGPFAFASSSEILENQFVDCVVIGEGERVLHNLVSCFIKNKSFKDVKGIAYRKDSQICQNPKEDQILNIDEIPLPDYQIIDLNNYFGYHSEMNFLLHEKQYAPIMTSRGCPFQCVYCHSMFGKKMRFQSPERVLMEIKYLYQHRGIREFHIIDDNFNINRTHMHSILKAIIASQLKIKLAFPNGLRGDCLNEADFRLLKQAGAYMVTLAVETASKRMQKIIKKNLNIAKVRHNIKYANKIGLITNGFFMLGFPGEKVSEMYGTINFALKSGLDMAFFVTVTPFPGTELYRMAIELSPDIKNLTFDSFLSKQPLYQVLTGFNIVRLQKLAYLRFYNFKRLFNLFLKAPRKTYLFFRFTNAFLTLFKVRRSMKKKNLLG